MMGANASDEALMRKYNRWHSRFDQLGRWGGGYDPGSDCRLYRRVPPR
ncbi:MAG: hypothetical protein QOH49_3931 [Acidobacteriota bacterium]|jgi:hypothetical protein|nr:hypothetical protein [Acidobacteriota bacterium]